jgi:uncharacterized membrane protein
LQQIFLLTLSILKNNSMNAAQIHLALNHVPLFLSLLGGGILILGMIRKNESFKTLSLYMLVAAALFTAPVFLTGEGTEELVEHLPGVNEQAIEKHEDMAKIALIVIIITGAISLLSLLLKKNAAISKITLATAVLFSLASFGTMAQTAHLGGLIRHSEMQSGSTNNAKATENEEEDEEKSQAGKSPQLKEEGIKDSLTKVEKLQTKDDDD